MYFSLMECCVFDFVLMHTCTRQTLAVLHKESCCKIDLLTLY